MAINRKVLWIVGMTSSGAEKRLLAHAQAAGADTVCIRTSNAMLKDSIKRFKDKGLSVYAWRWPKTTPSIAKAEAENVADKLIPAGLDGYIADPESDNDGSSNDWSIKKKQAEFKALAASFCKIIKDAAPKDFMFGTTSGCNFPGPKGKLFLPWDEFFAASDRLYPQCYWRAMLNGKVTKINFGTPAKAMQRGLDAWLPRANGKPVIPMAGEINLVTAGQIAEYGQALSSHNISEAHFYTDTADVDGKVLDAIKAL